MFKSVLNFGNGIQCPSGQAISRRKLGPIEFQQGTTNMLLNGILECFSVIGHRVRRPICGYSANPIGRAAALIENALHLARALRIQPARRHALRHHQVNWRTR